MRVLTFWALFGPHLRPCLSLAFLALSNGTLFHVGLPAYLLDINVITWHDLTIICYWSTDGLVTDLPSTQSLGYSLHAFWYLLQRICCCRHSSLTFTWKSPLGRFPTSLVAPTSYRPTWWTILVWRLFPSLRLAIYPLASSVVRIGQGLLALRCKHSFVQRGETGVM